MGAATTGDRSLAGDYESELEVVSDRNGSNWPSDMVHLGDEDATVAVLSQGVLGLWEVVNNLERLRQREPETPGGRPMSKQHTEEASPR